MRFIGIICACTLAVVIVAGVQGEWAVAKDAGMVLATILVTAAIDIARKGL